MTVAHSRTKGDSTTGQQEAPVIRIQLPEAEAQRLEELFRSTDDRKLRDRLQIVLLAHKGRPRQQIAADLAVHRRSVTRWLNAYCDGGLDALMPRKPGGKAASIPDSLADEIKAWVIGGPAGCGLDRANWTHEELAEHLGKAHGIRTSRSAMQRFCARIGIRPYRPTYRFLRADPAKQRAAREDLEALKKSAGGRVGAAEPG
jgi:transposase